MIPPNVNDGEKQAEWRGYMLKAVEDIDKELNLLRVKVEKIDDNVNSLYVKVAGIGAVVSILTTALINSLK